MVAVARTYKARESLSLLKEVLQLGEPIPGCSIAQFSSEKALTERQCDHVLDGTAFSWASSAIGEKCGLANAPLRINHMMLNAVLTACAKQRDQNKADVVLREMHEAVSFVSCE